MNLRSTSMLSPTLLKTIALQKGYGGYTRHIFLCTGEGPCTEGRSAEHLWQYLKQRLQALEPDARKPLVGRSKTDCLRICKAGPVALVYPEGTLYYGLDEQKLERIIVEHLFGGKPVDEFAIVHAPLQSDGTVR